MKKITLFAFLLTGFVTFSQKNLTIEEATKGFGAKSVYSAQWKNNSEITYIEAPYKSLILKDNKGKTTADFVTTEMLEEAISKKIETKATLPMIPFDYHWESNKEIAFTYTSDSKYYMIYNLESKEITKVVKYAVDAVEEVISPNKDYVVYLDKNNIKVAFADGTITQITNDEESILNGNSNTHRNEFGIDRGLWISPDGSKILYYKKDERMVTNYPLVNFGSRIAEEKPVKYPMAGMKSEEVSLHIYDLQSKKNTQLRIEGDKEQFLTMPTWDPTSQMVYVGVLNRGQDHLKLQGFNANTGEFSKQLFEETYKSYVEPNKPLKFLNDKEFLYVSEKEGYRHLYKYNISGKQLQKYTFNDVVFKDFVNITKTDIYYLGTGNKGMDKVLYKTAIKSGKTNVVTKNSATYNVEMNADGTWYYAQYSNFTTPNNIALNATNGKGEVAILNAPNPYEGKTILPKVEVVSIKAADGKTDLNGRLLYPSNFDSTKKYPVMVYVYGGPHAQLVTNRFGAGAGGFDYYMAQQGYVVFTLDNRGSENRGRDFEHVIHRNLGQHEMADQMEGVKFLKSKSFVDVDKIGVYGWSYGGFMTTSLMLNYPDTFKVGVAGGPVIDWKWYEIMYGERYMDTPEENKEGYEKTSTLNKVKDLKGRLLIIHGAQDPVVVQQHSMEFIEKCIKEGKQVDYFLYPTHEHNVLGKDRAHLNAKIADYFETHLK